MCLRGFNLSSLFLISPVLTNTLPEIAVCEKPSSGGCAMGHFGGHCGFRQTPACRLLSPSSAVAPAAPLQGGGEMYLGAEPG